MQFKCIFEKDTFRKELDKSVIDSLDDNFQLVTDCSCKQMHNLFPTVDNSDGQEFVVPFDGAFKLSVLQSWLEA